MNGILAEGYGPIPEAGAAFRPRIRALKKIRLQPLRNTREDGFTLVELLIVMSIIVILLALAVPKYQQAILNAKEASLREDLQVMRQAIDSYTMDKERAPQSLDDLVSSGYLRAVPVDPITRTKDTWQTVTDDTLRTPDQTEPGITDVHSSSQESSQDGTLYSTW